MRILLMASDPVMAAHISELCSKRVSGHRLTVVQGSALQLAQYTEQLKKTDFLMVNAAELTPADLTSIEAVLAGAPQLNCMLIAPPMSTQQLTAAMHAGVRYVMPTPLDAEQFRNELAAISSKLQQDGGQQGRVLSFVACKGGSGTTMLAANLASARAASSDEHVLLIDLDQQFSNASLYLTEKRPTTTLVDLCEQADRLDNALFDASVINVHGRFDLLAGPGDPVRSAEVPAEAFEQLLTMARQRYDTVVVDVGQNIDQLSMEVLDQSETICTVLQADLPHLYAGKHLVDILLSLGYDRSHLLLLLNQYDPKNVAINLETFKEKLGVSHGYTLPADIKHVSQAVMQAKPLIDIAKSGPLAKALASLSSQLWPSANAADSKPARRGLFGFRSARA